MELPFLALALPAVVAVVATACITRPRGRPLRRGAILLPVILVGAILTAGFVAALTSSALGWRVATQVWTVTGHAASITATVAWVTTVLAWGRGVWLGVAPPSRRHALWSAAVGAAAFVGIFAGRTGSHAIAFRAATGAAGWLLFLWFPLTIAVVALVHERDLERSVLPRAQSAPGRVWLTVLSVPMLAVALLALLVAVVAGDAAPFIARVVVGGASAIWSAIAAAAKWLWHLLPHAHSRQPAPHGAPARHGPTPAPIHLQIGRPGPALVWEILVVVLAVVLVSAFAVLVARNLLPRLRSIPSTGDAPEEEERSSVFSWRHLASQLWGALLAAARRLRPRPRTSASTSHVPEPAAPESDHESVRQAYLRVLVAARAAGHGRASAETARELQARVGTGLDPDPGAALARLTDLYDRARYAEDEPVEAVQTEAAGRADVVAAALAPPHPPTAAAAAAQRAKGRPVA